MLILIDHRDWSNVPARQLGRCRSHCRCEQPPTIGGLPMSLAQFEIDDGPHSMDGLRLFAGNGPERVEAFIGRKVMDVWADSVEHLGGRRSLFRGQYNAVGEANLAA